MAPTAPFVQLIARIPYCFHSISHRLNRQEHHDRSPQNRHYGLKSQQRATTKRREIPSGAEGKGWWGLVTGLLNTSEVSNDELLCVIGLKVRRKWYRIAHYSFLPNRSVLLRQMH